MILRHDALRTLVPPMLLTTLLATELVAQFEMKQRGPFAGMAQVLSVAAGNTGNLDADDILHKPPGDQSSVPGESPSPFGVPQYDRTSLFGSALPFELDAMSAGIDELPLDGQGKCWVASTTWAAFTYSVTNSTVGSSGTVVADEAATGGAGADLFSYIVPGSGGFEQQEIDVPALVHDAPHIDISGIQAELDAHDLYIPVLTDQNPPISAAAATELNKFYFSVSTDTIDEVPPGWWQGTAPSGATILTVDWDDVNDDWLSPVVFKSWEDLGLKCDDDIDALTISHDGRIILSTTSASLSPLLVWLPGFTEPERLEFPNGDPVAARLGLLNGDDIDAICAFDPDVFGSADIAYRAAIELTFGSATPPPPPLQPTPPAIDPEIGLSVTREFDPVMLRDCLVTLLSATSDGLPVAATLTYVAVIGSTQQPILTRRWDPVDDISIEERFVVPNELWMQGVPMYLMVHVGSDGGPVTMPTPIVIKL